MWKVLVVEDEPFVRRSFIQHIDWSQLGFAIAGEAEDGAEALERIRQLQPDLVISDIVMPIMNGLELISASRREGCEAKFIMLTCMNEFVYAQEAIHRGASGYILKSSLTREQLEPTLQKVKAELQREKQNRRKIEDYVWSDWYDRLWGETLSAVRPQPQLSFPTDAMPGERVTVVSVFSSVQWNWNELCWQCGLQPSDGAVVHEYQRDGVISWFVWGAKFNLEAQREPLLSTYVACAIVNLRPEQLRQGWRAVLHRICEEWYEPIVKSNRLIRLGALTEKEMLEEHLLPWVNEKELLQSVDPYQPERFDKAYEAIWSCFSRFHYPIHQVKEIGQRLLRQIAAACGMQAAGKLQLEVPQGGNSMQWRETMRMQILQVVQECESQRCTLTDHPEVNKILEKIHLHYNEPLSLSDLSDYVNLEEHYVSALFKRKLGMPFLKYLNQYRVEKSKLLLVQSRMPASEIGQVVGFSSENHFAKMFKRWTGVTPGVYRQSSKPQNEQP